MAGKLSPRNFGLLQQYLPTADFCIAANQGSLFDHFIGKQEQRWRYCETKRLGGFEINHKVELCRLLHGQVGWLRAAENLVNVKCGTPKKLSEALAVTHKSTSLHILPLLEKGR